MHDINNIIFSCETFRRLTYAQLLVLLFDVEIALSDWEIFNCSIKWVLADRSSRQHQLNELLELINLGKCNPAYLLELLQMPHFIPENILVEIHNAVDSSFFIISQSTSPNKILTVDIKKETGAILGDIPFSGSAYCMTDHGLFVAQNRECALVNIVTSEASTFSLPKCDPYFAVYMGNFKVYIFCRGDDATQIICLNLRTKLWEVCALSTSVIAVPVNVSIFNANILYGGKVPPQSPNHSSTNFIILCRCHY